MVGPSRCHWGNWVEHRRPCKRWGRRPCGRLRLGRRIRRWRREVAHRSGSRRVRCWARFRRGMRGEDTRSVGRLSLRRCPRSSHPFRRPSCPRRRPRLRIRSVCHLSSEARRHRRLYLRTGHCLLRLRLHRYWSSRCPRRQSRLLWRHRCRSSLALLRRQRQSHRYWNHRSLWKAAQNHSCNSLRTYRPWPAPLCSSTSCASQTPTSLETGDSKACASFSRGLIHRSSSVFATCNASPPQILEVISPGPWQKRTGQVGNRLACNPADVRGLRRERMLGADPISRATTSASSPKFWSRIKTYRLCTTASNRHLRVRNSCRLRWRRPPRCHPRDS